MKDLKPFAILTVFESVLALLLVLTESYEAATALAIVSVAYAILSTTE